MARTVSGGAAVQQAPIFWLAALVPLTIAAEMAVAPALFDGLTYAPIRAILPIAAVLFAVGGGAAALALAGFVPQRWVAGAPLLAAVPIGILAVNFALVDVLSGVITYGLIVVALLATALALHAGRRVRGRPFVLMTGAIVLALGASMVLGSSAYANTAVYAQMGAYLWIFAPLFVVAGGGLILTELGDRPRIMLSFASLTAVSLAVLVGVFASTHIWTGALVYGLLAVVLMLAAPRLSVSRQSPVLFASLAALAAAGDLVNGSIAALGGTSVVPTWTLMRIPVAFTLLLTAIGFALAREPAGLRTRRVAIGLGVVAACAAAVTFVVALASPAWSLEQRVAAIRGEGVDMDMFRASPQSALILTLAALVLTLYAARPRWRVTTLAFVLFGTALSGLVALNILAYMLDSQFLLDVYGDLGLRQHTAVAFGALALGVVTAGLSRLMAAPIADRVLGMLVALAALVLTRNYLADAALAHVFVDTDDLFRVGFLQAVESARSLMLVLIAVVAAGAGVVFTRTVTQPLGELLGAIARARAGEVRARAEVEGSDEIGIVARSFNQMTRELADQSDLYAAMRRAQSDLGDAILVLEGGEPRQWNEALSAISGYSEEELRAMPTVLDLWPAEERAAIASVLKARAADTYRIETRLIRKAGESADLEMAIIPLPGTAIGQQLAVMRDITERRQGQRTLERQALFDGLTQLPNRALLRDRLDRTIAAAKRANDSFSLIYLDLDRFKEINDAFGHDDGDTLLTAVAVRLGTAITTADTLARFGGDEFAILLPHTRDLVEAAGMGEVIRALLMKPFELRGHRVFVEASIGVVLFPADGLDSDTLLRRADIAMYQAKRSGKGIVAYHAEHDPQSQHRLDLLSDLRQAIAREELFLHY